MNFCEKYMSLKSAEPFCGLEAGDAAAIAAVCSFKEFEAGETVVAAGSFPTHLFTVVKGSISCGGREFSGMFAAVNLIKLVEFKHRATAGANGAQCLVMTREHFLSAVKNCPQILAKSAQIKFEKERAR